MHHLNTRIEAWKLFPINYRENVHFWLINSPAPQMTWCEPLQFDEQVINQIVPRINQPINLSGERAETQIFQLQEVQKNVATKAMKEEGDNKLKTLKIGSFTE